MDSREPLYRETIPLAAWVVLVLLALFAVCALAFMGLRAGVAAEVPGLLWLWDLIWIQTLLITIGVPLFFGRMQVFVGEGMLVVRFGFVPAIRKEIPLERIASAEAVHYRPIRDFGGWGLRRGMFAGARTAIYSMRGSTAVLLSLERPIHACFLNTDRILIGNLESRRLAEHLNASA